MHVPGSVMHCELLGTMTSKSARDAPANISLGLDHIHVCHEGHYCASFCLSQALMGDRHSLSELRASSLFTPHHNSLTENQCGHHHGRITSSGAIGCLEPSKRTGGAVTVEPVRLGRSFMIPPFNLLAEPCRIWSLHVYWWRWVVTADIWGPPTLHISAVSIIEHEADDCSIPRCLCVSGAA